MFIKFLLSAIIFLSSIDQAYSMIEPEDKQENLFIETYKKLTKKDEIANLDTFETSIGNYKINIWPTTLTITVIDEIKSEKNIKNPVIFEIYKNNDLFYKINLNPAIHKPIKDIIKKFKLSFKKPSKIMGKYFYRLSIEDFNTFLSICFYKDIISQNLLDWLLENNFLPDIKPKYHIFNKFNFICEDQNIKLQKKIDKITNLLSNVDFYDYKYEIVLYNTFYYFIFEEKSSESAIKIYKNQKIRFNNKEMLKYIKKLYKKVIIENGAPCRT